MDDNALLKSRIHQLAKSSVSGDCVLYVMSRDQRVADNHALIAAQKHAQAKGLPLAVAFCLYPHSGKRAREHYDFMLAGLRQVEKDLATYNIPFLLLIGKPYDRLNGLFHHTKPDAVYFDFSPLKGPINLKKRLAEAQSCAMYDVDTHNVVPVWVASDKQEFGAYTIRPKLHKNLGTYLVEPIVVTHHKEPWPGNVQKIVELSTYIEEILANIQSNGTKVTFNSGELAAKELLEKFITMKLERYGVDRNDPASGSQSDLSPYLHFGQISSLRVALRLQEVARQHKSDLHFLKSPKMPKPEDAQNTIQHGIDALIEEMIVRKELADNFCYYNEAYDSLSSAPDWAKESLHKHRSDVREQIYSYKQLRDYQTHDNAWNAAQAELRKTGKMHGYMRMYWAKKVLEWTESPEQAVDILIRLNDFYSIDGGDPNGYAGIIWSVGGVHDRPWIERPIFGKVRYMNYAGLKRKFAIERYEQQWLGVD